MSFCSPRTRPRDHHDKCLIMHVCYGECFGCSVNIYDVRIRIKYRPGAGRVPAHQKNRLYRFHRVYIHMVIHKPTQNTLKQSLHSSRTLSGNYVVDLNLFACLFVYFWYIYPTGTREYVRDMYIIHDF